MKRIRREADRTARQMRDDVALVGTLHVVMDRDETDIRMFQFPLLFVGDFEDGVPADFEDARMILEALDSVVSDTDAEAMWDHYWSADALTLDTRWLFNLAWKYGISLESWRINPMFAPWAWAHLND